MDMKYTPRSINKKIQNYVEEILESMESLEYEVEDDFEQNELLRVLAEDLPRTENAKNQLALLKDICDISDNFFKTTNSKKIRIQFKIVTTDMCRLFHVDNNIQRLLCTYKGAGTQWLEESNLDRRGLGQGDNNKIVIENSKIKKADEFSLLLLKGKRFSYNTQGAVHRSPPIGPRGKKRVLLKIDEI